MINGKSLNRMIIVLDKIFQRMNFFSPFALHIHFFFNFVFLSEGINKQTA